MKSIFSVAALSTLVAAQSVADLPSCAVQCLSDAVTAAGCSPTDQACSCGDARPAITDQATPCILDACSIDEALMVQTITDGICANLPADGASSSAAPESSAAMSTGAPESSAAMSTGGATPTPTDMSASPTADTSASATSPGFTGAAAINRLDSGLVAGVLALGAALL